ncbi:hypothetical protein EUGRSUZ_B00350 [Eucalyptus grandis]|uniref:Uncharacterized protein n=2 Tax=Eucalyptus grandis TaxID=71139 RepID=A0ACC3LMK8_EUCGR|nr:hypothetical protein EUGRSUZ_B00350 [Eucalyptus grandis]
MNARLLMAWDNEHNFSWLDKLPGLDYMCISPSSHLIFFISTEVYSKTKIHIAMEEDNLSSTDGKRIIFSLVIIAYFFSGCKNPADPIASSWI